MRQPPICSRQNGRPQNLGCESKKQLKARIDGLLTSSRGRAPLHLETTKSGRGRADASIHKSPRYRTRRARQIASQRDALYLSTRLFDSCNTHLPLQRTEYGYKITRTVFRIPYTLRNTEHMCKQPQRPFHFPRNSRRSIRRPTMRAGEINRDAVSIQCITLLRERNGNSMDGTCTHCVAVSREASDFNPCHTVAGNNYFSY